MTNPNASKEGRTTSYTEPQQSMAPLEPPSGSRRAHEGLRKRNIKKAEEKACICYASVQPFTSTFLTDAATTSFVPFCCRYLDDKANVLTSNADESRLRRRVELLKPSAESEQQSQPRTPML
eukprot:40562-Amphidinium_carterae.1